MTFRKVALAGATGNLGRLILRNLLQSSDHQFEVVILTRATDPKTVEKLVSSAGLTRQNYDNVEVATVDYNSLEQLVQAIRGTDIVISALAGTVATQLDVRLHKAVQAASIRRFVPAQFTLDLLHPNAQKMFLEDWPDAPPVASAKLYKGLGEIKGLTSYTIIMTGMFVDTFLISGQFGVYDLRNCRATLVDDGSAFLTGCSTEFVANTIVELLKLPEELTKNKRIPIAEVRISGNEIVETIEQVFNISIKRDYKTSEQLMVERKNALSRGDFRLAYAKTVIKLAGDGLGASDLKDGLQFDAEGRLKLQRKTLKQMVEHVKEILQ